MTTKEIVDPLPEHPQAKTVSFDPLDTTPTHPSNRPTGSLPNTPFAVSLISVLLGSCVTVGLVILAFPGRWWWATAQLGFYAAAWAWFHEAEFAVTAGWNREKVSVDSFLLTNGIQYHIAHSVALIEYLITLYLWPSMKRYRILSAVGMLMTLAGQALRSAAMIQASSNFSHLIARQRLTGHQLVTTGVYAYTRHPAYTAFFYWALGTQIALLNPLSFFGFAVVLWRFFSGRIRDEERFLVRFFGDKYVKYRQKVGTWIPFVR